MSSDPSLADLATDFFRGRALPEPALPVGYAQIIEGYGLRVPCPPRLTAISTRYRKSETKQWLLLGSRTEPPQSLGDELTLALKWEGVNLGVLKALFDFIDQQQLVDFITEQPKSAYGRRIWFLYEWLTSRTLPIDDLGKATAVPVVDPKLQFALEEGELSTRHRVLNNLPGTPAFCPLVRRTDALESAKWRGLAEEARAVLGRTHPDVLRRAGAFLLLADSRASFQIEGEHPPTGRLERWGQVIRNAGRTKLSVDELVRLQHQVVGDARFVHVGLREEDGFVGMHDRRTHEPIPDHISARPKDLPALIDGVIDYVERGAKQGSDPIGLTAAAAFGFVYIHPFEDGNGRVHRWLIHHALAVGQVVPNDVVFPVSRAMLRRIDEYRLVLESYSSEVLPLIEWEPTESYNVRVKNETADYYRFFDATAHAEFLLSCIEETIRVDLPNQVRYLEAYDQFEAGVQRIVDMPQRTLEVLKESLDNNDGRLSNNALDRKFSALQPDEVSRIEALYSETLGPLPQDD